MNKMRLEKMNTLKFNPNNKEEIEIFKMYKFDQNINFYKKITVDLLNIHS